MAASAEEIQAKIDKLEINMARLDAIVNGSNTTDIPIDSGTVPSIAKFLTSIGNSSSGYLTQTLTATNQAISAAVTAKLMANQFTGIAVGSTTNFQIRSEEFDNVTYTKLNVTATANTVVAPDNTTTGDKIAEQAVTGLFNISAASMAVTGGLRYTRSVWVKAVERNIIALILNQAPSSNSASAIFDLGAGIVSSVLGSGATAAIENWGNGWFRCALSVTAHASATSTTGPFIQILSSSTESITNTRLGVAGSGVQLWGAQFQQSDSAGPYAKTITASTTVTQYSAKHWADAAASTVAGVASFNGRSGAVVPVSSDYTATQIVYNSTTVGAQLDALVSQVIVSSVAPTSADGSNGQIWFQI